VNAHHAPTPPSEPRYRNEIKPSAAKALAALTPTIRRRIDQAILALAHDPRPRGAEPVRGIPGVLRIREGDYRILYTVHDDHLIVLVIRIGHRREVYR
jgi:mRNA interferase RelE/StbE